MTPEVKKYQIEKTLTAPYLGENDQVINGYTLRVRFIEFDELHEINVPDLSPESVKLKLDQAIKNREAVRDLG